MSTAARTRLLVVGGDAAGMSAAHQGLRESRRRGRELDVVVLERTDRTSYSACGLPYLVAGDVDDVEDLVARTPAQHRAAGIDLRLGTEAVDLDLDARTVTARSADGGSERLGFDLLVLATGATPRTPSWALTADGGCVPGVGAVRTLADGQAWLDRVTSPAGDGRRPDHGVVVGGGYIGIEMAEAFLRRGLRTTLVTRREVMGTLEPELGARVREAMVRAGVEVVCGEDVDALETGDGGAVTCVSAGPHRFDGDLVALGVGAVPATSLAAGAGLPLGSAGGLLPDDRQEVAPGVWAAGDCVESLTRIGGQRVSMPLGTHANKQGRVAGTNLAGGDARFGGVLGTAITRFVAGGEHVEIARTGPSLAQCRDGGFDPVSLATDSTTASGYMPEAAPITVLAIADRTSRRLLGVQVVGGPGSAKRVDTAAAAIWLGASVDDVAGMDLSYAPPFSPVFDPVQIACRRLAERL